MEAIDHRVDDNFSISVIIGVGTDTRATPCFCDKLPNESSQRRSDSTGQRDFAAVTNRHLSLGTQTSPNMPGSYHLNHPEKVEKTDSYNSAVKIETPPGMTTRIEP